MGGLWFFLPGQPLSPGIKYRFDNEMFNVNADVPLLRVWDEVPFRALRLIFLQFFIEG